MMSTDVLLQLGMSLRYLSTVCFSHLMLKAKGKEAFLEWMSYFHL